MLADDEDGFLRGIIEDGYANASENHEVNHANLKRRREFQKKLDSLLSPNQDEYQRNIRLFLESLDVDGLYCSELMSLIGVMIECQAHELKCDLYNKSSNKRFLTSSAVKNVVMDAYNFLNQPAKAIEIGQEIIENNKASNQTFSFMGKAYWLQYMAARNCLPKLKGQTIDNDSMHALQRALGIGDAEPNTMLSEFEIENIMKERHDLSREMYERGFLREFNFYPGMELAYRYLETGDFNKAQQISNLVFNSTFKDGALESQNFWATSAMLQSACLIGADSKFISSALEALFTYEIPMWQLQSVLGKIENIVAPALEMQISLASNKSDFYQEREALEKALMNLKGASRDLREFIDSKDLKVDYLTIEDIPERDKSLLKNSFSYRGISLFESEVVSGNIPWPYNGMIPDHSATWRDKQEFGNLIALPLNELFRLVGGDVSEIQDKVDTNLSLLDIKEVDLAISIIQMVVRFNFETEKHSLEIIDGKDHKDYIDIPMRAIDCFAGLDLSKKDGLTTPSRTSLSAEFAKGTGDCRQHAYSTQMFFDLWQAHQLNEVLRTAWGALQEGDSGLYDSCISEYTKMRRKELRTFEVEVHAPVKMDGIFKPVRPLGHEGPESPTNMMFMPSDKDEIVEEHALTILLERNSDKGNVESAKIVDSFYFEPYHWKKEEIPIGEITISDNGRLYIPAGKLFHVQGNDEGVKATLVPLKHSGTRKTTDRSDKGEVWERGLPYKGFKLIEVLKNREGVKRRIDGIKSWYTTLGHENNHSGNFFQQVLGAIQGFVEEARRLLQHGCQHSQ